MSSTIVLFVDYYNLSVNLRKTGSVSISKVVLDIVEENIRQDYRRVLVRFYGGWYIKNILTIDAQRLSAEISAEFPVAHVMNSNKMIVDCELALTLRSDMKRHIWHTMRKHRMPTGLFSLGQEDIGCDKGNCIASSFKKLLETGVCPIEGCTTKVNQILGKDEQKLVDAMIASDMIHCMITGEKEIVLVSSDDDFFPAIQLLVQNGVKLIQVNTKRRNRDPRDYYPDLPDNYLITNIYRRST
ncbi:MAG: NYN domain-containing protein [Bacteroidetes bacterium]|nr:NYN domain-containing protein [Bacteroidota bacterium]